MENVLVKTEEGWGREVGRFLISFNKWEERGGVAIFRFLQGGRGVAHILTFLTIVSINIQNWQNMS